jgi:hypothetical protein
VASVFSDHHYSHSSIYLCLVSTVYYLHTNSHMLLDTRRLHIRRRLRNFNHLMDPEPHAHPRIRTCIHAPTPMSLAFQRQPLLATTHTPPSPPLPTPLIMIMPRMHRRNRNRLIRPQPSLQTRIIQRTQRKRPVAIAIPRPASQSLRPGPTGEGRRVVVVAVGGGRAEPVAEEGAEGRETSGCDA